MAQEFPARYRLLTEARSAVTLRAFMRERPVMVTLVSAALLVLNVNELEIIRLIPVMSTRSMAAIPAATTIAPQVLMPRMVTFLRFDVE